MIKSIFKLFFYLILKTNQLITFNFYKMLDLRQFKLPQEWVQMFRGILLVYLFWLLLMAPQRPIVQDDVVTRILFLVGLVFLAQSDILSGLLLLMIYFLSSKAILPLGSTEGFENDDENNENENNENENNENENDKNENDENEDDENEDDENNDYNSREARDDDEEDEEDEDEEDDDLNEGFENPTNILGQPLAVPVGYNFEDEVGSVWRS